MPDHVPIAASLADIYTPDVLDAQTKRWNSLLQEFKATYSYDTEFVARSPGRVNIIGEHIDYSLYPVLPMAITADTLLAVSTSEQTLSALQPGYFRIKIANVQKQKFDTHVFDIHHSSVDIDETIHEWTNYFKAGLRGALEILRKKHGSDFRPKCMSILMDGSVPAGGGLSSSAAFVTASALAVLVANGEKSIDKTELTELAIVSERAVGVNSGGMDQSASVFGQRGSALFVSFKPRLTAKPIAFPKTNPELTFLIAQSFVQADKYVTGPIHYNLRVVECTLAAAWLHSVLNPPGSPLPTDNSPLGISLAGFHEMYVAHADPDGRTMPTVEKQLVYMADLVKATLKKEEGYTREEIADVMGLSVHDLADKFLSRFIVRADKFKLRQRALHVYEEALRVVKFMDLLEETPSGDTSEYNAKLGNLLNESQESCKTKYECSCPEINRLCEIAVKAGSYGSRLTGAGWGGCSVHLVPADKMSAVKEAWEKEYYSKMKLTEEQKKSAVVVSRPGSGSTVFMVEGKYPLVVD
ncbi:ribosomal protein S5 domain 2-type protein [Podospora fimiseda]|uniref:Galactokinase n=1 Tax=Podospora fimiseda TaxID=252190 RepID=A0AAN7BQB4_9PEZI|nr:ribosomal protein S5 domain 2-type protein [Podospora fimiseda]